MSATTVYLILIFSLFIPPHPSTADQSFISLLITQNGLDFVKDLLISEAISTLKSLWLTKIDEQQRGEVTKPIRVSKSYRVERRTVDRFQGQILIVDRWQREEQWQRHTEQRGERAMHKKPETNQSEKSVKTQSRTRTQVVFDGLTENDLAGLDRRNEADSREQTGSGQDSVFCEGSESSGSLVDSGSLAGSEST
ncbi:hypothetical protein L6452_18784 [Arctium lappa]|uniref:Uncharacterized protein n=1 Tax=Arctium lappa TaxID=4217 RepID=A0ACB9C7B3_ARCLA|nr:hypothetical protein L6452_18784 [Arctium lappa]